MFEKMNIPCAVFFVFFVANLCFGKQATDILFPGEKYLKLNMRQQTSTKAHTMNRFDLQFQTVHPSGLLLMAVGSRDAEMLILQLIHGSLRYVITTRSKTSNRYYTHHNHMGSKLDDNKWHAVQFVRNDRLVEIQLDGIVRIIVNPLPFKGMEFQRVVYVGGYEHFNHVMPKSLHVPETFVGCLRINEIDNRSIQKILHHQQVTVIPPGEISFSCEVNKIPAEFKRPTSFIEKHLNIELGTTDHFIVSFSIRTFSRMGLVFSTGDDLTVSLFEGRLVLLARKLFKNQLTSERKITDGLWHQISIDISKDGVTMGIDKKSNLISSQRTHISGKQRKHRENWYSRLHNNLSRMQRIRFGAGGKEKKVTGFVGCLHKVTVQNNEIDLHSQINGSGVTPGCTLLNKCFPNPCRNGGSCSQSWNEFICDCTRTNYHGKLCEKINYRRSCEDYKQLGLNTTSYCLIDPDGEDSVFPSTVVCEFNEYGDVYTVVNHNKMKNFSASQGDERFQHYTFHNLQYVVSDLFIRRLIENSRNCRQKMTSHCYKTPLFNAPDGPPNVGWKKKKGHLRYAWGSVSINKEGCDCGLTRTCEDPYKLCNCDSYSTKWLTDTGYNTDKNELPIHKLHVRQTTGSLYFNIGPLECSHNIKLQQTGKHERQHLTSVANGNLPANLLQRVCVTARKKHRLIEKAIQVIKTLTISDGTKTTKSNRTTRHPPTVQQDKKTTFSSISFSILEIVLLSIACFATVLILVKFVLCAMISKLRGNIVLKRQCEREKVSNKKLDLIDFPDVYIRKSDRYLMSPDKKSEIYLITPEKKRTDLRMKKTNRNKQFYSINEDEILTVPSSYWV